MRCTFKTVFYVNGSKERNGIVPIMGRVTINGTIAQFSCKQSVTKAIWDAKGNRAIAHRIKTAGIKRKITNDQVKESNLAAFVSYGLRLNKVELNAGLRYEHGKYWLR